MHSASSKLSGIWSPQILHMNHLLYSAVCFDVDSSI